MNKTHNVAMVSPVAQFVVSLGIDGRVASQGTVAEAMVKDKEMQMEAVESQEANKKEDEVEIPGNTDKKPDGKLVVAEEIAEGHISMAARECFDLILS